MGQFLRRLGVIDVLLQDTPVANDLGCVVSCCIFSRLDLVMMLLIADEDDDGDVNRLL